MGMFDKEFDDQNISNEFKELIDRYQHMIVEDSALFFEEEEFEWIIEYFESRNELGNAMLAVSHAMLQYPYSETFLIKKAELLFEEKEIEQAMEMLDKASIYDASDLDIYLLRSEILVYQGEYNKAAETLKHSLQFANEDDKDEVYLSLAEVYESWEKFELVFQYLKKVLEINPFNEEALGRIWFCVDITEKYGESIDLHKSLIDIDPYSHMAWYNLGHAYFGSGLYEKACEAFEYVTLINEDFDMAYRDWGEALIRLDKPERAIEVLENALRFSDPYEEVYFALGICYEKTGKYNKARYYYRKAVHLDPYYHEAVYRIAENFRMEERYSEALNTYKKALKLNNGNIDYLAGFAEAAYKNGNVLEAANNYELIIKSQPSNIIHWTNLIRCRFELGDSGNVMRSIDEALISCGEKDELYYLKSACLYINGSKQAAIQALQKGMELNSENYKVLFQYAPVMSNDGDILTVIDQFKD